MACTFIEHVARQYAVSHRIFVEEFLAVFNKGGLRLPASESPWCLLKCRFHILQGPTLESKSNFENHRFIDADFETTESFIFMSV